MRRPSGVRLASSPLGPFSPFRHFQGCPEFGRSNHVLGDGTPRFCRAMGEVKYCSFSCASPCTSRRVSESGRESRKPALDCLLAKLELIVDHHCPRWSKSHLISLPLPGRRRNLHQIHLLSQQVICIIKPNRRCHILEENLIAVFAPPENPGVALHSKDSAKFLRILRKRAFVPLLDDPNMPSSVDAGLNAQGLDLPLTCHFRERRCDDLAISPSWPRDNRPTVQQLRRCCRRSSRRMPARPDAQSG